MVKIFRLENYQRKKEKPSNEEISVVEKPFIIKAELKRLRKDFHERGGFDKIDKIMINIKVRDLSSSNLMEKREIARNFTIEELLGWITNHEEIEWGGKEAFFKAVADEILDRFHGLGN